MSPRPRPVRRSLETRSPAPPAGKALDPRIGVFSSTLPGWGSDEIVAAAVELGASGAEWGCGPGEAIRDRSDARQARVACDRAGVAVFGLAVQDPRATLAQPARLRTFLRLASELGAPSLRVFAPPMGHAGLAAAQKRCRDALAGLVDLAAPLRVRVLVEVAPQTIAPSPGLALALVGEHDPREVGVLYDPGNMAREGHVAPRLAVDQLGRYLAHVHLKNVAPRQREGTWVLDYARLEAGVLDWEEIIHALAGRYRGGFAVDHLRAPLNGRAALRELAHELAYVERLLSGKANDASS